MHEAEIAEIDAFIAEHKTLEEFMPPWQPQYGRGRDWQVRWAINDAHGNKRAELCLECDAPQTRFSISCIYARNPIYRLDLVPDGEWKLNPLGAAKLGLPPVLKGPHIHPWFENRGWVSVHGLGELKYRKSPPFEIGNAEQALEVVARDLNIVVESRQRDIRLPAQRGMFPSAGG